ncbi:MAG: hypothetical protein MUP24_07115 [Gillisia sp.]|nr:hypothetical protein [Gillisia sp.]
MEKVRGMGLKPFVIIFFNPLAEARGNGWNCLYREQFLWTRHKRSASFSFLLSPNRNDISETYVIKALLNQGDPVPPQLLGMIRIPFSLGFRMLTPD